MLNEAYGITERDFARAEIEVVPAYKARDIGLDRAMIGAYGHDDRVDAYPALMAEIGTKSPAYTSVCVLTDKEETGSDGVTGLNSMYVFHFVQQLCKAQGADDILCFQNSTFPQTLLLPVTFIFPGNGFILLVSLKTIYPGT